MYKTTCKGPKKGSRVCSKSFVVFSIFVCRENKETQPWTSYYSWAHSLFRNKRFLLDEMFQLNAAMILQSSVEKIYAYMIHNIILFLSSASVSKIYNRSKRWHLWLVFRISKPSIGNLTFESLIPARKLKAIQFQILMFFATKILLNIIPISSEWLYLFESK